MISKDLTFLRTVYGPWLQQLAKVETDRNIADCFLRALDDLAERIVAVEHFDTRVQTITRQVEKIMAGSEDRASDAQAAEVSPKARPANVVDFPGRQGTPA